MDKSWYVYIMADHPGGLLYIGITNNIFRRIEEHKNNAVDGFTKRYQIHHLVYYETYMTPYEAITREKQLKHWNRAWKIRLIKTDNPFWKDLSDEF
jgi:putative endonuclease